MKLEKRYQGSMVTVLAGMCVATLALALLSGCGGEMTSHGKPDLKEKPASLPVKGASPTAGYGMFEDRARQFNKEGGVKPPPDMPPQPKVTLEEAEEHIGTKLRIPKETLGGKLTGIWTGTSASCNREASLGYDNGIAVGAEVWKEKPDFRVQAAHEAASAKQAEEDPNITRIGAVPHVVEVAGFEMLSYPTYYFEHSGDKGEIEIWSLPPMLYWWDNGIKYHVGLWKLGFSEEQLWSIAKSMY